ncbi:MAG: Asp-tRNA(Asn)/Glu-tRNA(Gln) amidotransferase GatCAB subunit A, partial [Nitrospirae bacterium]
TPPFRLGEKLDDPLTMYLSDIFTIAVSLAGLPAVSFPCGTTEGGLPLGAQLIGRPFDEGRLLALVHAHEQAGPPRPRPAL